jgi:hypothetical protein
MSHPLHISAIKLITNDEFVSFVRCVRDFCNLVESQPVEDSFSFIQQAQLHLQRLYIGGKKLQAVELIHNTDFEDLLSKAEMDEKLYVLSDRLGDNRYYWHVFDPLNEKDTEAVCGDLLDDMGDIYKDLKKSLLLLDKGMPAEIETAAWTFKWSFDHHWGDHCSNAIYALHYFIQRAR